MMKQTFDVLRKQENAKERTNQIIGHHRKQRQICRILQSNQKGHQENLFWARRR